MELSRTADSTKDVAIVIPVFNEERYLARCLDSVMQLRYSYGKVQVILVDNGSTDNTIGIASNYNIQVLIKPDVKVGAVRNFGVDNTHADIIVFLDSDCVVESDWLDKGVSKLYRESALVLGGQYTLRENPSWMERNWILTSKNNVIHQSTLVGGCIFIRREDFLSVDGFREELNSGEDSDLTNRLLDANYSVVIDPSLSVIHLGYPRKISEFVGRQIWHSSDYISQLPKSLKDKVFINTCVFFFGMILLMLSIVSLNFDYFMLSVAVVMVSVLLLSGKRIFRSKYKGYAFLSIFLVDFLYLVGRSIGIFKGVKNIFETQEMKKVSRR